MTNFNTISSAALVDMLGGIKAEKAELAAREKAIKAVLSRRMGDDNWCAEGDMFRVSFSSFLRETLDTAAVKKMLSNPPMKRGLSSRWDVHARVADAA